MSPNELVASVRTELLARYKNLDRKSDILKSSELKELFSRIPTLEPHERASFGQAINALSNELKELVANEVGSSETMPPIDVTAPMDINAKYPTLLPSTQDRKSVV